MAYRNLIGADNFFETASKEELIDFLIKKINSEVEKGDGADCDLIRECSDWLDELTKDEVIFTPEELKRNLEKIKVNVLSNKPTKNRNRFSAKTFVRVALIAAVIFTISILSLSVVASNQGYDSTWGYISENIEKIFNSNVGDKINEHGITIVKQTQKTTYFNMDELIEKEKLSIMYPCSLPNDVKINQVYYIEEADPNYTLSFVFSNSSYNMYVKNYYYTDQKVLDTLESLMVNDVCYYFAQTNASLFHAICQNDGFEYTIQCENYEDLIFILNNMKG